MEEKLPVDFEERLKAAPSVNGRGYPYQLSAGDLMSDLNFLLKRIPSGNSMGDILYWAGSSWQVLPAASGGLSVLTCESGQLSWTETEEC